MEAIAITLLDVVSVRDGRAFDAGGATLARALWPLPQWTLAGAIRALFVRALGLDPSVYGGLGVAGSAPERYKPVTEMLGDPQREPNFNIGPCLLRKRDGASKASEFLFPTPADLFLDGGAQSCRLRLVARDEVLKDAILSGFDYDYCALPPPGRRPSKHEPPEFISSEQSQTWLKGGTPAFSGPQNFFVQERRIGICIDSAKGTVTEGMFYVRKGVALEDGYDLVVPILEERGAGKAIEALSGQEMVGELGGDRHLARFTLVKDFSFPKCFALDYKAVLWFLSPVQPKDVSAENLSKVAYNDVRVLAVVAHRPVRIGGWKMARVNGQSFPRPMRLYYPWGTCVYIEVKELEALSRLHGASVATDPEEKASGFGVCLIGDFPKG
jgi:CRISPR type III-B/RAMP module-associated protein Cmr3